MKTNKSNPVTDLNTILNETFGGSTKGMIARAPMWGHADNCWVIYGERAAVAAKLLAGRVNGRIGREITGLGETFTIEWV